MTSRNRLLVVASTYPRWKGDPEPGFVHELAKRLTAKFDVTVLAPHAKGASRTEWLDGVHVLRYRYAPEALCTLVNDGGIVSNLRHQPWKWLLVPPFLMVQAWQTWRVVRAWRPDVIHAHWLLPQGLLVALLGMVERRTPPFLVTSHGADLFALRTWPLPWLKRFVLSRAAAATVVSHAMREQVRALGVEVPRLTVQPMGVDLQQRFIPDAAVVRSGSELLFVGRLVEKKGLRHLLDAMPEIARQVPGVRLNIAGFGPEEAALKAQANRLGITGTACFLGPVSQSELPRLYQQSAAFVAPFVEAKGGDQEGLGLVLVEALGCGCPVVTTRIPAIKEVFGGRWPESLAEPGSWQSIAEAVVRLLNNHADACIQTSEGLAALRERFDWQLVAAGYARLLSSICVNKRDAVE